MITDGGGVVAWEEVLTGWLAGWLTGWLTGMGMCEGKGTLGYGMGLVLVCVRADTNREKRERGGQVRRRVMLHA